MGRRTGSTPTALAGVLMLLAATLGGCHLAGAPTPPAQEGRESQPASGSQAPRAELKAGPWTAVTTDPETLNELRSLLEPAPAGLVR